MQRAPEAFSGSLRDLYREHMEKVLPKPTDVARVHSWMDEYCEEGEVIFPVRAVRGTERRRTYTTTDGTRIARADNSPAWVMHCELMRGGLRSSTEFQELMRNMPVHMFDLKRRTDKTANQCGWYVAHVIRVKNGNTNFSAWDRDEVKRRFYLTLHPCNLFFVPGVRNSELGENPNVIQFVTDRYVERYGDTWTEFLERVMPRICTREISDTGDLRIEFGERPVVRPKIRRIVDARSGEQGMVRYSASRLTFKRDEIEQLRWDEKFEVTTPMGVYRFTKREFYEQFPRIPQTASYREIGLYHGARLHLKAEQFRVSD
jgi:hypothetical protein